MLYSGQDFSDKFLCQYFGQTGILQKATNMYVSIYHCHPKTIDKHECISQCCTKLLSDLTALESYKHYKLLFGHDKDLSMNFGPL
jgi:hypothetical protein